MANTHIPNLIPVDVNVLNDMARRNQGFALNALPGSPRANVVQTPIPEQNLNARQVQVFPNNQYTFNDFIAFPGNIFRQLQLNNVQQNPPIMEIKTINELVNFTELYQKQLFNPDHQTILNVTTKLDCRHIPTFTQTNIPALPHAMSIIQECCTVFFQNNPLFPQLRELQLGDINDHLSLSNLSHLTTLTVGNADKGAITLLNLPNLSILTVGNLTTVSKFPYSGKLNLSNLPSLVTLSLGEVCRFALNLSIPQLRTLAISAIWGDLILSNFDHLISLTVGACRQTIWSSSLKLSNLVNLATITLLSTDIDLHFDNIRLLNLIPGNIRESYKPPVHKPDGSVDLIRPKPIIETVKSPIIAQCPPNWQGF